jgi:serine/threonine-protein kinase
MSPEQWTRAKALFGTLVDRDPTEWPEVLSSEIDTDVAAEVRRLLAAHLTGADFLDKSPAAAAVATDPLLGQTLGPFRVQSLLGEGGGGRVYLAERNDVGGKAAVKILPGRFADRQARRRFQAEQSILARLDHPNIARLLQVGVTDDGTPWLAMEYVEGRPFAEAMAALPVPERLRMIIKLLDAVDYAHRQLIVHRDIKPGNILVDPRNEPRLLDFGIAKRLDDAFTTNIDFQARTPAYSAPEQVLGQPISAATDVYTMGVLLYEILSGHHPWLGAGKKIDDAILAGNPALPSSWLKGGEQRRLQGDLDAIVLQAMHRDPARRYPGAMAMADDLRRYLEHRPVRAQQQTWHYRARRFVVRNRRLVAAGVALVALLSLALVREHRLREEAALEAEKANEVADFMIGVFAAGDAQGTGFTLTKDSTVMDLLARGAARLESLQSAPLVRADLAQKMGEVYWGHSEYGRAEDLFKLALGLRQAHLGPSNETAESHLMLGRVYERTGRYAEMIQEMQTSYDLRLTALGADDPATIQSLHRVGAAWYQLQQLDRAVVIARQAIQSWRRHLPAHNLDLANSLTIYALSQLRMGNFDDALGRIEEAMHLRAEVLPDNHNLIAEGFTNHSRCLFALGRVDEAIADIRQSLAINGSNYTSDHWDLVLLYEKLARYLVAGGGLTEAESVADKATAMAARLHQRKANPELVNVANHAKVVVLCGQGHYQPALALAREVLKSREQSLPPLHSDLIATRSVAALLLRETGAGAEADAVLVQALDSWRQRPYGYTAELDEAMDQAARAGHCDWLMAPWPSPMSARMGTALQRDRRICAL